MYERKTMEEWPNIKRTEKKINKVAGNRILRKLEEKLNELR